MFYNVFVKYIIKAEFSLSQGQRGPRVTFLRDQSVQRVPVTLPPVFP